MVWHSQFFREIQRGMIMKTKKAIFTLISFVYYFLFAYYAGYKKNFFISLIVLGLFATYLYIIKKFEKDLQIKEYCLEWGKRHLYSSWLFVFLYIAVLQQIWK